MKMNNKKIIVSTLALAMGAALAGSVSGTVAWFQYSTRAQASFIGSTVHCSEALEIAVSKTAATAESTWKTELGYSEIDGGLLDTGKGTAIEPITAGGFEKNAALPSKFYKNPIYQFTDMTKWGEADATNLVKFDLYFHVKDIDEVGTNYLDDHNLYLTNLSIVSLTEANADNTEHNDIYKAIRVHLSATGYEATFAPGEGTSGVVTTATSGNLDLNNDGNADKPVGYEWESVDSEALTYGSGSQTAYGTDHDANFADDTDPSAIGDTTTAPGLIGAIPGNVGGLKVSVTIWLEGWQELAEAANSDAKVWDPAEYIGQKFGVGFRFATELHETH